MHYHELTAKEIYDLIRAKPYKDGEKLIKDYGETIKNRLAAMILDRCEGASFKMTELYELIAQSILNDKLK